MKIESMSINLISLVSIILIYSSCSLNDSRNDFVIVNDFNLRMQEEEFQGLLNQKIASGDFGSYNFTPKPLIFDETDTVYGRTYKRIKVNAKSGLANHPWGFDPYFHNDSLISVEMFTRSDSISFHSLIDSLEKQYDKESQMINPDSIKLQPRPDFEILLYRNTSQIFLDFNDIGRMNTRDSIYSLNYELILWNEWGDSWDINNKSTFKNKLVDRHIKIEDGR